jgi:hypothetical protein
MKQRTLILVLCCLILVIEGCEGNRIEDEFFTASEEPISVTPTLDFAFLDSRAACQTTSDCILMRVGGCENVQAIHLSQVGLAEAYTKRSKKEYPNIVCAPDFPIEEYEPLCLNQKCQAILLGYRLILEVPEQPVIDKPFWLGMSFRFHVAAEEVNARFMLPESLNIVSGQTSWSGPVEALEDHIIWVEVLSKEAGKFYLGGWAGITQGDTAIPPLIWSEYITVVLANSLTPQPMGMPILATPTLTP